MIYARVEKGEVTEIGLPETGILKDGRTVSGYNLLPEKILKKEGWVIVEEERPAYDQATEHLVGPNYKVKGNKVVAEYTVERNATPQPVVDERAKLINEIDGALTLAELRRVLVKIVAPEIANDRKMH